MTTLRATVAGVVFEARLRPSALAGQPMIAEYAVDGQPVDGTAYRALLDTASAVNSSKKR